jgi:glycosyltransferase involved in cell wall biosynthesis
MGGVELFVVNQRLSGDAPFDEAMFAWMANRYQWDDMPDDGELIPRLEQFHPDVILCANWHHKGYRKALAHFKERAVRIFTSDRTWQGTPRQWLGVLVSRFYLRPLCEAIFVAGEPHAVWARRMGFSSREIFQGMLSCDHGKFSAIYFERKEMASWPHTFVFVGRFAPEKGLDVLARAYEIYRENTAEPWPLKCYGVGPLQHLVERVDGIECRGFCQPDELPGELKKASCLILPSTYDGWAIVVHEAVSAGMAVIVTDAVGASAHLVRNAHNGYLVEAGRADELAQAMLRYCALNEDQRRMIGENSYRLSLQFTPERWANTLLSKSKELMANSRKNL